jgi:hypothetical protein
VCHERIDRAWERTTDRTTDEENDDLPEFLNEESGDLDVLTDGGDEE